VENFEKIPEKYQDPVLWAWTEFFFNPLWYEFQNNTFTDAFIIFKCDKDDCFEYLLLAGVYESILINLYFAGQYELFILPYKVPQELPLWII